MNPTGQSQPDNVVIATAAFRTGDRVVLKHGHEPVLGLGTVQALSVRVTVEYIVEWADGSSDVCHHGSLQLTEQERRLA